MFINRTAEKHSFIYESQVSLIDPELVPRHIAGYKNVRQPIVVRIQADHPEPIAKSQAQSGLI